MAHTGWAWKQEIFDHPSCFFRAETAIAGGRLLTGSAFSCGKFLKDCHQTPNHRRKRESPEHDGIRHHQHLLFNGLSPARPNTLPFSKADGMTFAVIWRDMSPKQGDGHVRETCVLT